jgi:flagellar motor protein MotB
MKRRSVVSKCLIAGAAVLLAAFLAGCQEQELKNKIATLESSNTTLQNKLSAAEQARRDAEDRNRQLQAELAAAQEALKARQTSGPTQPPPVQPPPVAVQVQPKPDDFGPGTDVVTTSTTMTVNIAGDVLFDSGKAGLRPEAQVTLNKIAAVLKSKYAGHKIRVIGHTDSDPIKKSGWKDNWELSTERAKAVGAYLIRQGVAGDKLEMVGVANTEPRVSPEKTDAEKKKNRRVSVQVVLAS